MGRYRQPDLAGLGESDSGTPIMRKGLGNANDLVMSIASDTGQLRMAFGNPPAATR